MNGTDDIRGLEYSALMHQVQDLGRTAQWCWTGSAIAAAVLLSNAVAARHAGLLLPVEFCAALGFYAMMHARRQARSVEGYVLEFHEKVHPGAQWFMHRAQLRALPGLRDRTEWVPLALANAITLVAVVYSWVFASGTAHGELMAAFATMGAMAFSVHSMAESMQVEQAPAAASWSPASPASAGLREVTPAKRAASDR